MVSENPVDQTIGANLRTLREARHYTQVALAARLGISFQQLQKYETGRNRLSAARLHEIARLFGIPPARFFDGLDNADGRDMASREARAAARLVDTMPDAAFRRKIVRALEILVT